jgi:hypothetical protein
MQIKPIDPCAVQVLLPHRDPILLFFAVEKEWYATDDEQLLGALIFHRTNNDWAYIVFGPDQRGFFRWIWGGELANTGRSDRKTSPRIMPGTWMRAERLPATLALVPAHSRASEPTSGAPGGQASHSGCS